MVGGIAVLAGSITMSMPAGASIEADAVDGAAAVVAVADASAGSSATSGGQRGLDVEVPLDPDAGLTLDPAKGPSVSIGLPGSNTDQGVRAAGNVVYDDAAPDTAVVARPTAEGVQALVVIDGPEAPGSFRFPIEVGAGIGAKLSSGPGGTVQVQAQGTNASVATVLPAWARDARGARVPTHFEIDGSTLVQVVDHEGAAYPVVADPNTCGYVTCTYYFGKIATRDIATSSILGGGCGILLRNLPPVAGGCFAAFAAVNVQAQRARNRGMCLKIKYSRLIAFPVWYPDIYGDKKYCK